MTTSSMRLPGYALSCFAAGGAYAFVLGGWVALLCVPFVALMARAAWYPGDEDA